jgi:predicted anti-sigma-YlaC factor YlaD
MNCERFQNRLYEYMEGTLSAGTKAAADRHLSCCCDCQQSLRQEQQLAQFLANRLRLSTETLTLRPEIRQGILTASRRKSDHSTIAESIVGLWNRFTRPAIIVGSMLLFVTVLLTGHFSGIKINKMQSTQFADRNLPAAVSIEISYRVPIRQFQRQGNLVLDTMSYETVVATGIIRPGGREPFLQNQERKKPL